MSEDAKAKPADSAGSTPAESAAGLRTWHDASGTFSVEAVMLSQQDGNVVLQKKDGKTVRVALKNFRPPTKNTLKNTPAIHQAKRKIRLNSD